MFDKWPSLPICPLVILEGVRCDGSQQIKCSDGTQCVFAKFRCDGYEDCRDGSDEKNCSQSKPAQKSLFQNKQNSLQLLVETNFRGEANILHGAIPSLAAAAAVEQDKL